MAASGKRIVVTRSRGQMAKFTKKLSELGADVLEIPAVKGADPDNKQDFIISNGNILNWLPF